jgi:hypothetical protein
MPCFLHDIIAGTLVLQWLFRSDLRRRRGFTSAYQGYRSLALTPGIHFDCNEGNGWKTDYLIFPEENIIPLASAPSFSFWAKKNKQYH